MLALAVLALALAVDPAPGKQALQAVVKQAVAEAGAPASAEIASLPFTAEVIRRLVAARQPQVQACYEEHLAAVEKPVEGTLKTRFVITALGLVREARVDRRGSTLKDPRLHECVAAVLSTLEFPRPPDGAEQPVEFPFNLKAIP